MIRVVIAAIMAFSFGWAQKEANALVGEESPYLRQHAHNPVKWLPWSEEIFEIAKREHKPIFLSIGYSTCHWCHVMEEESFENEEIAELINRYFIPVKVDKEERPDIDRYYQRIYQIMHQRGGGWPLTIIMTEDGKPFFAATYIPPEDGYGVKGMKTILPVLAKAYKEDRETIEKRADAVLALLKRYEEQEYVPVKLDLVLAEKFLMQVSEGYDPVYKGFSKRIKFPEPSKIEALIDIYMISEDKRAFKMADETLKAMARGGIFDQIEGGFFRYTTDRRWQIPHFEKMLYTNAQILIPYIRMYLLTKERLYKDVVLQTLKAIDSRFFSKGLYRSASDADSEGTEGGYFIYNYDETLKRFLKEGFSKERAIEALKRFGITPDGNIDGENSNPYRNEEVKLDSLTELKALNILRDIRSKRKYPFVDEKIITSWNAMIIETKIRASCIEPRYLSEALESLDTLLENLYIKKRLYHQMVWGKRPTKEAMLEDYAYLIKTLLVAYQYSFEKRYLDLAKELATEARRRFYRKRWYLSEAQIAAVADLSDAYYTSPLAVMIGDFLTLSILNEDKRLYEIAKSEIDRRSALIFHNPALYPQAFRVAMRIKLSDIVIKSDKKRLKESLCEILSFRYPYILLKSEKTAGYLACAKNSCFATVDNLESLRRLVENRLKMEEPGRWRR